MRNYLLAIMARFIANRKILQALRKKTIRNILEDETAGFFFQLNNSKLFLRVNFVAFDLFENKSVLKRKQ